MQAQYNCGAEQTSQQENAGAAAGAGAGPSAAAGAGPAQAAPSHPVLAIRAKPSQQKAARAKPAARTSWPGCNGTVLPDPVRWWWLWVGAENRGALRLSCRK